MDNYTKTNKAAWEDAYDNRMPGWGGDVVERLKNGGRLSFFDDDIKRHLERMGLEGKSAAQFCCNNGRELLSMMDLKPARGVGIDITENMIAAARETAKAAGISNCEFYSRDLTELGDEFKENFDFILFTIGALPWFKNPDELFRVVANALKPGGRVLISDMHPFVNMLPFPGEPDFDENNLDRVVYPYFREEPWIEGGMSYMTGEYKSKPFISFSHTISMLISGLLKNGIVLEAFEEYDYDVGVAGVYEGRGYPLSYIMTGRKEG